MNSFEQLLFFAPQPLPRGAWTLIQGAPGQLLPVPVPFAGAVCDLTPAVELYSTRDTAASARFVELRLAACPVDSRDHWALRLIIAMLRLEQGEAEDAWCALQFAVAWRNSREQEPGSQAWLQPITPAEWLVMAVIALAINDFETAEKYASEAVARIEQHPMCCVSDLLCDTRADAMTVFAAIKMAQQKYQEAEMLLQLSHDAYAQVGDMQQLIVVLILLADIERHSGSPLSASFLLCEAACILHEDCDPARHHRLETLRSALDCRRRIRRLCRVRSGRLSLN